MIDQHVTSLELSKQLYESKIGMDSKAKSIFVWAFTTVLGTGEWMLQHRESWEGSKATMRTIPAYLSSELGEMMPNAIPGKSWIEVYKDNCGYWVILYRKNRTRNGIIFVEIGDTEANARAKMLIFLKEKGLI